MDDLSGSGIAGVTGETSIPWNVRTASRQRAAIRDEVRAAMAALAFSPRESTASWVSRQRIKTLRVRHTGLIRLEHTARSR